MASLRDKINISRSAFLGSLQIKSEYSGGYSGGIPTHPTPAPPRCFKVNSLIQNFFSIFFQLTCKTHTCIYISMQKQKSIQVQSNLQSRTAKIGPLSSAQHIPKCLCKINQIIWVNWFQATSASAGGDWITGCLLMKYY